MEEIMSTSRRQPISEARQVAMMLCYETTRLSTRANVAGYFSKNKSLVSHSIRRSRELSEAYPNIAELIATIKTRLGAETLTGGVNADTLSGTANGMINRLDLPARDLEGVEK